MIFNVLLVTIGVAVSVAASAPSPIHLQVVCTANVRIATNAGKQQQQPPCHCKVDGKEVASWTAKATLLETQNITGWGEITVETNPDTADDSCAAYAAGFVEAAITPGLINLGWRNSNQQPDAAVVDFIQKNNEWVLSQVKQNPRSDYWSAVGLTYTQLMGIVDGYESARGGLPPITALQIQLLGMNVELGDIEKKVNVSARPDWSTMSKAKTDQYIEEHTHCSALVRATPDLSEIYFSHVTWYKFPFKTSKAQTVMFSGYPGELASIDDFYLTSQQLAVMETTNSVFNCSRYRTGRGPEWHELFYRENSGTYNNQWMTLDYKLFTPRQPLPPNLFWVSEQMPGWYRAADQTAVLQRGHWPSYNVPFYPD
eukprot:gene8118-30476_t